MKKLIITCALVTSASMVSFAQANQTTQTTTSQAASNASAQNMPSPEQMAERHAKAYEQQLKLTPEQYKGVYQAELDFTKQHQQMRANGGQPGSGQVMQMNMAKDQKFKQILTAEQYAKYDATRPKMAAPKGQ